jgi:hypothetical protein
MKYNAMKQKIKKQIFLFLLISTMGGNLFAQLSTQGKDFWVSFGSRYKSTSPFLIENDITSRPIAYEIEIITGAQPAPIEFSFTDNSSLNITEFTVPANTIRTIQLSDAQKIAVYNNVYTGSSRKSLHITSKAPVAVYAIDQFEASTDATNIMPSNSWGQNYYLLSYQAFDPGRDGYIVIAKEADTHVYEYENENENPILVATLGVGGVYQKKGDAGSDLTGKHITADKPIAFFESNSGARVPHSAEFSDIFFQQEPPISQWGKKYVVPNTIQKIGRVRVMAACDANIIQTGAVLPTTNPGGQRPANANAFSLDAGEWVEFEISGENGCYIVGDKQIGVCAYLVSEKYSQNGSASYANEYSGDPSISWIPPIDQLLPSISMSPFFPSNNKYLKHHYALIITPTATRDQTRVSVGGGALNTLGVTWRPIATSGYSFATYGELSDRTYRFENPAGLIVGGYGLGSVESYYYVGGAGIYDLNADLLINGESYKTFNTITACPANVNFEAILETCLQPQQSPGSIRWILDGVELNDLDDTYSWNRDLSEEDHQIELKVRFDIDGIVKESSYITNFTVLESAGCQEPITLDKTATNVVCIGEEIHFQLTVTNHTAVINASPPVATRSSTEVFNNISIKELFPNGVTYVSHTASKGTYNSANGVWAIDRLEEGDYATLHIVATASTPGTVTNRAYVSAVNGDTYGDTDGYADASLTAAMKKETVTLVTPDSLIWRGAKNADWNDYLNWTDNTSSLKIDEAFVPGFCTDVLIPAAINSTPIINYPDLTPGSTTYSTFPNATCNHIWFEHGGEVMRTDSLHYTEAYVDLKIQSNQWYMLSAPLQNMNTGDFYEVSPNPFYDGFDNSGLFVEPMFFNVANPQTGFQTASFKWTGTFNGADSLLQAGQGLALWAGDSSPDYAHQQDVLFRFPKTDTYYKYYYTDGTESGRVTSTLERIYKNRFIYEPTINKTAGANYGNVPLYFKPATGTGESILVGNPFMAHLKFDKFVELNDLDIENEYKLAYGLSPIDGKVTDFVTYKVVNGTFITTDENALEEFNYIPPMQSFIVISKRAIPQNQLKANITETRTLSGPNNKLRSASSTNTLDYLLEITTEQNQQPTSKALLLYMNNASNAYIPAEDSYKLFSEDSKAHVLVYLRSSDGYALDINSIGNLEQAVPLGIRTNQKGQIRLKFEGTDKFLDKANIFLHDTKANKVTNMSLYKEYTFNKDEDDLYLENRFYITFNNGSPTGIKGLESASVSIQMPEKRTVQILSNNGNSLGRVQITDVQGRNLVSEDVKSSSYTYQVKTPGMYIIRVGSDVKKAIIN